jgi:flagellar biosynthesis protein FliQ
MPISLILDLTRDALWMTLLLSGPIMAVALVVGLLISVLQTVTSVQEQTLTFVPKLIAVGVTILVLMSWMIQQMLRYTTELFRSLPGLVG